MSVIIKGIFFFFILSLFISNKYHKNDFIVVQQIG